MPTPEEIQAEKQALYEIGGVRDDLNDAEATILLAWAEKQIDRLAQDPNADFSQKNRFLRQLLARIDRFVGQRQYMDAVAHDEQFENIMTALGIAGYADVDRATLLSALPADKTDMRANLTALLAVIAPPDETHVPHPLNLSGEIGSARVKADDELSLSTDKDGTDPNNPLSSFIRNLKNLGNSD